MKICFVSFPLEKNIEAQEKLIKKYGNYEPEEADYIVALGGDGFILKSLHNYMKLVNLNLLLKCHCYMDPQL